MYENKQGLKSVDTHGEIWWSLHVWVGPNEQKHKKRKTHAKKKTEIVLGHFASSCQQTDSFTCYLLVIFKLKKSLKNTLQPETATTPLLLNLDLPHTCNSDATAARWCHSEPELCLFFFFFYTVASDVTVQVSTPKWLAISVPGRTVAAERGVLTRETWQLVCLCV